MRPLGQWGEGGCQALQAAGWGWGPGPSGSEVRGGPSRSGSGVKGSQAPGAAGRGQAPRQGRPPGPGRGPHLLQHVARRQPPQVLQVGVEQRAAQQAGAQQSLHDVAHRAVVRQPHPVGRAHETAQAGGKAGQRRRPRSPARPAEAPGPHSPGPRAHLEGKAPAQAEAGPAGGEPELDSGRLGRTEPPVSTPGPRPHREARAPALPRRVSTLSAARPGPVTHSSTSRDPLGSLDGVV